jgi:hypothetical protein
MRTISLRLDAESDAMLRALCDRLNATQTDVVRKALELLASDATPTPGELGVELGLAGGFSSGGRGNAVGHSQAVKARLEERRRDQRPVTDAGRSPGKGGGRRPRATKP